MTDPHPACKTCRFFRAPGDCRRYPPTVVALREGRLHTMYPHVYAEDWCGEWQAIPPPASPTIASPDATPLPGEGPQP
jgi:hypothetical protein